MPTGRNPDHMTANERRAEIASILAAALAQRRGESGCMPHLACYFKAPMRVEEHEFFKQWRALRDYAKGVELVDVRRQGAHD